MLDLACSVLQVTKAPRLTLEVMACPPPQPRPQLMSTSALSPPLFRGDGRHIQHVVTRPRIHQ